MEQVKNKRKITREEMEKRMEKREQEKARRITLLDTPDLTEEEKELLVDLKMALEDDVEYTMEEMMNALFGEGGLCT